MRRGANPMARIAVSNRFVCAAILAGVVGPGSAQSPRRSGTMTNLDTTPSVNSAEQRLKALGIELPVPPEPFGTNAEAVQTGNLLFLTGMLPTEGRRATFTGRIGRGNRCGRRTHSGPPRGAQCAGRRTAR